VPASRPAGAGGRTGIDVIGKGFREADRQARFRKLEATPLGSTSEATRAMIKQSSPHRHSGTRVGADPESRARDCRLRA
jgi:hypothetical protein